jgi:hypothetical protein
MRPQFLAILAVLLSLLSLCGATPLVKEQSSNCRNITISVPISAWNTPISESLVPTSISVASLLSLLNGLGALTFSYFVTGTYETAATYCEPQVYDPSRENTLQFLVHGATYTKSCKYNTRAVDIKLMADRLVRRVH